MKIESHLFRDLINPEIKVLKDIFLKHNHEIRIAGGAVRDLLVDKMPEDIDFATTATPTQMKEMFNSEGIRMINNKGESHGTITARVNDKFNYEITTLRIDKVTDGRHAEVEFTNDWQLDSERRDLTINSMFLDLDGVLYDYFNGYNDLMQRKVAFVGSSDKRIKEDYLRILRYFRFYGKIAINPDDHDSRTIEVIKDNVGGIAGISGERIWTELNKILRGNHVVELVTLMMNVEMAPFIGLSENVNLEEFKKVMLRSKQFEFHPMTMLSALMNHTEETVNLQKRLKFPNFHRDLAVFLVTHRYTQPPENEILFYKKLIFMTGGKLSDVQKWACELIKYSGNACLLEELSNWKMPKFPVSGHTLMEQGIKTSNVFKHIIAELKDAWIDSDFTLSEEQLIEKLPEVLKVVESMNISKNQNVKKKTK